MGQSCQKTQKQTINYSVKTAKNENTYGDITFSFSTERLNRLNCDCLLLFTDNKLKVNKNKYLVMENARTAQKIQQYLDFNIPGQGLPMGSSILFQIDQPNLSFSYICILCLGVWKGSNNVRQPLQVALQGSLNKITSQGIQNLAITQVDEQYGIPVHSAYKSMTRAIHAHKDKIKSVIYLCDSKTDQDQFESAIKNYKFEGKSQYSRASSYY